MMTGNEGAQTEKAGLISKISRTEMGNKRLIVKGLGLRAQGYDYDLGQNNRANHILAAQTFIRTIPGAKLVESAPMMEETDRIDSRQFIHIISY